MAPYFLYFLAIRHILCYNYLNKLWRFYYVNHPTYDSQYLEP